MKDQIDEIFQKGEGGQSPLPRQEGPLTRGIPGNLPFRTKQISEVAEVLAPALHQSKPSNLLLYGKTGTGKTAVARRVVQRLAEQSNGTIQTPYVNTRIVGTEDRTLSDIAAQLGIEVPFTGLSIGELVSRIFKGIQSKEANVVLILDEIDYLVNVYNDDILYEFTRAGERITPGFLSLIGISNNLTFKEGLDARGP